jgi:hypothetical protein
MAGKLSYEKVDRWLVEQGFELRPELTIEICEPLWMKHLVYVRKGYKEYYLVNVMAKLHTYPLVLTGNVDKLFHGRNVDTIASVTTIDCESVNVDFRKKLWREMINKD